MARFLLFCIMATLPERQLLFSLFCHNFYLRHFCPRSEALGGSAYSATIALYITAILPTLHNVADYGTIAAYVGKRKHRTKVPCKIM